MSGENISILDDDAVSAKISALIEKRKAESDAHEAQAWQEHRARIREKIVEQGYQYIILLIDELLDDAERLRTATTQN